VSDNAAVADSVSRAPVRVPTVAGPPWIRGMYRMKADPLRFLVESSFLGAVVRLGRLGLTPFFQINEPALIEQIFLDPTGTFVMTRDSDVLRALFDGSVFMLKGAAWQKRRRMLHPAFHSSRFGDLARGMAEPVVDALSLLSGAAARGETVDLEDVALDLVQRVIVRILFGRSSKESGDLLREVFTIGMTFRQRRRWSPVRLPLWVPTPRAKRFRAALAELNRIMHDIVEAHPTTDEANLLTLLLEARDPDTHEPLTGHQVIEEVKTIFNTGFVTTATAICWTVYAIASHPDVEETLRREIDEHVAGAVPTFDECCSMPYLDAVINETLRLYPPGWMTTRRVARETLLDRCPLPRNAIVIMSQYASHRRLPRWTDPERFDPGRFVPPGSARPSGTYYPFGIGGRRCIGREISLLELRVIVPALVKAFRWSVAPGARVETWPLSALMPRHGVPMKPSIHPPK
jgi:cytochrome P450